jgi:hypothetical protein
MQPRGHQNEMRDVLEQNFIFNAFPSLVWNPWSMGSSKVQDFFAWLVLQNRVWMAARLAQRGYQKFGLCELCNQHQVSDS